MAIQTIEELFERVLPARTSADLKVILNELGDKASIGLNQRFGSLGLEWVAYGGSESNESTIGLASKAGRSLTERITNGIDALLELTKSQSGEITPRSPAEAASAWYGRAPTGPRSGLYNSDATEGDLSRAVSVVLSDSGTSGAPTVDVIDAGIGLSPMFMPTTILSLQQGNKVKKPYLMGTFGQGGSSTLAFADYVVIISRNSTSPEEVGFTIVRLVDPGADYELDVYAYLTVKGNIPSVAVKSDVEIYGDTDLRRPPTLRNGTLVRHIGFKLSGLDRPLSPSAGNLYHYLHLSMFDPLLPFRVMDVRGKSARDERVGGARNRLMRLVEKGSENDDSGNVSILHHHEMEDIVPLGSEDSRVGVEYWVVEALRKTKDGTVLRGYSSDLFVDRRAPIVATMNGQNQGEIEARFIRDLGLGMVSRHIVVHLDASRTDRKVRRELFTTTREGFKEGPQLDNLKATLARILKEDTRLAEIEQQLADRVVGRENRETNERVKRQITSLLRDAGFSRTADGDSDDPGGTQSGGSGGTQGGGGGTGGDGGGKTDPLPTKPFPDVTRWEIVSPQEVVRVRLNGLAALRVETDADERFDVDGLIDALQADPRKIEVASETQLRGGRKQWRLRVGDDAKVGDTGTVSIGLRTPNGGELRTAIKYEVTAPVEGGNEGKRGLVPDFEVLPISPDDEEQAETWALIWPQHENASRSARSEVAYRVFKPGDKTIVYYSTGYAPYVRQVERISAKSKALVQLFDEIYQVWVGYHAILQLPDDLKATEEQQADLEMERCRVAQVQIRVATEMAELQRRLGLSSDADAND